MGYLVTLWVQGEQRARLNRRARGLPSIEIALEHGRQTASERLTTASE